MLYIHNNIVLIFESEKLKMIDDASMCVSLVPVLYCTFF
jgi:hypothetical protein